MIPFYAGNDVRLGTLPGMAGDFFSTLDDAAQRPIGDFTAIIDLSLDDWGSPSQEQTMYLSGNNAAASTQNILLRIKAATGEVRCIVPTGSTNRIFDSSVATGFTDGTRHQIKIDFDVDNGSGNSEVTFSTADDGETFNQLGTKITDILGASNSDTSGARVGSSIAGQELKGKLHRFQLFTGIDGTLAVDFNPSQSFGGSWTSLNTGEVWTLNGNAAITLVP